jgi:hypothetical protein
MKHFNKIKKFIVTLMLAMMVVVGVSSYTTITAKATDLSGVVDKIKNAPKNVIDPATETKVASLSKQSSDIVGIIVMAIVTMSGVWVTIKFAAAGENPTAKAVLKGAIVMHVLGLIFLASYFGFVAFAFKNLNLFK